MIRLNINDHTNLIDGSAQALALSSLSQNFPNPFSHSTDIAYQLANTAEVSVIVRDITGRIVLEKTEGNRPVGHHTLSIDAANLESGIYFYTLVAGNFRETKRMTVSR
jgi:hypothetical protein